MITYTKEGVACRVEKEHDPKTLCAAPWCHAPIGDYYDAECRLGSTERLVDTSLSEDLVYFFCKGTDEKYGCDGCMMYDAGLIGKGDEHHIDDTTCHRYDPDNPEHKEWEGVIV